MVEDFLDDWGLDRKCFNLSASMMNVFSWTYGMLGGRLIAPIDPNKFDNASSRIVEVGIRAFILLGAVASIYFVGTPVLLGAVVLSVWGTVFRALGVALQRHRFTHIRGQAPEKELKGSLRIMEWNIRGHGGGHHYAEGGVIHWKERIDRIVETILKADPDVLILQEVYDASLIEALVERLPQFAHFYTHLGSNLWGEESGILVVTKGPVHQFTHTDFANTDAKVKRGFSFLELKENSKATTPCLRIFATQFSSGKTAHLRKAQMEQIIDKLAKEEKVLPTLFVGSLNIARDSLEEGAYLARYLYHSYLANEPTHSEALVSQWAPIYDGQEASNDFISFFKRQPLGDSRIFPVKEKGVRLVGSELVRGFDPDYSTKTARSDHHAIVTEVSGL